MDTEEKDPHLHAVACKRRLALTGLPWTIASAAEKLPGVDQTLADEAAHYCRTALADLESFEDTLQHLSLALGRNIAIAELVWEASSTDLRLVAVQPVDFTRITFDDCDNPRVLTRDHPLHGIELPPAKFIVHTPHAAGGHPMRGGLLRATAFAYLGKRLTLKDWLIYAEVFGMPVRVARYDPSATAEEKSEVMRMLKSLGANAAAMFSRAVDIQFIEAGQGKAPPPYPQLVDFLNREMSKAWLGQTLTTETPGLGGTYAASKIHDRVRKDLRADDIRKEARTIRRDLLAPLTKLKFGSNAPVPFFSRSIDPPRSIDELVTLLDAARNRLGLTIPTEWIHRQLGIPQEQQPSDPAPK